MIPKNNRISTEDFTFLYRKGSRYEGVYSSLVCAKTPGKNLIGVVVSKKVAKEAVRRNYQKRRIKAVLKDSIPTLRPSFSCIVVAKKEILISSFEEIRSDCRELLARAHVFDSINCP